MFLFRSQIHPIENKQDWLAKLPYAMKIMVHQLVDWWPSYDCLLKLCHWWWISKKTVGGKIRNRCSPLMMSNPIWQKYAVSWASLAFTSQLGISQSKSATDKSKMQTSPHHNWNKTGRRGETKSPRQDNPNQKYWRKRRNVADKSLDIAVLP